MFNVSFKAPRLMWDSKKFNKTLRATLQTQIKQAARAFVRETAVRIPVDTGQARGTLLPLGRFLRVSVPIPGAQSKVDKNATTGSSSGKQMLFRFPTSKYGEYFEIEPQLFYYWWNDFFMHVYPNGQLPTPWGSFDAGREAFMEYMRNTAVKRLPRLKDFVIVQETSTGRFG